MDEHLTIERTGWRDENYSTWHRALGFNSPATDIDAIEHQSGMSDSCWLEFDLWQPVAIIELKAHLNDLDYTDNTFRPGRNLANKANLPYFVTQYDSHGFTRVERLVYVETFLLAPQNEQARTTMRLLGASTKPIYHLSEWQYVTFLYRLRDRKIPDISLHGQPLNGRALETIHV